MSLMRTHALAPASKASTTLRRACSLPSAGIASSMSNTTESASEASAAGKTEGSAAEVSSHERDRRAGSAAARWLR